MKGTRVKRERSLLVFTLQQLNCSESQVDLSQNNFVHFINHKVTICDDGMCLNLFPHSLKAVF